MQHRAAACHQHQPPTSWSLLPALRRCLHLQRALSPTSCRTCAAQSASPPAAQYAGMCSRHRHCRPPAPPTPTSSDSAPYQPASPRIVASSQHTHMAAHHAQGHSTRPPGCWNPSTMQAAVGRAPPDSARAVAAAVMLLQPHPACSSPLAAHRHHHSPATPHPLTGSHPCSRSLCCCRMMLQPHMSCPRHSCYGCPLQLHLTVLPMHQLPPARQSPPPMRATPNHLPSHSTRSSQHSVHPLPPHTRAPTVTDHP